MTVHWFSYILSYYYYEKTICTSKIFLNVEIEDLGVELDGKKAVVML